MFKYYKIILIFLFFYLNKNKFNFGNTIYVSIIVPIFNSEEFLSSCLKSIINQSLRNIEIICIDDGSTDKSLIILKEFKNIDNRLIILHQKNKGPAIARNLGIEKSRGRFIAFMDSDDLYPNNFTLELLFNKAIQKNVIICGGGVINFIQYKNSTKLIIKKIVFPFNSIKSYINYQYDLFYQRFIYKKNFIKKKKLYFPNYLRYQDPPFFIKAMALAKNFYALKNITYYYRLPIKPKILNIKKVIDVFKGIKDSLYISLSHKLILLYFRVLSHLNYKNILIEAKRNINNKELKIIILQIINNINYNLLKKNNLTFIIDEFYKKLK